MEESDAGLSGRDVESIQMMLGASCGDTGGVCHGQLMAIILEKLATKVENFHIDLCLILKIQDASYVF